MADMHDDILDNGLEEYRANAEDVHILSADPGLVWANIAALTIGNKAAPVVNAIDDMVGGGRQVTVDAFADGNVDGAGTQEATHFAIVDTTGGRILVSNALFASQHVTNGNTFSLTAIQVGIPDPA